jgi:hypothetical protein
MNSHLIRSKILLILIILSTVNTDYAVISQQENAVKDWVLIGSYWGSYPYYSYYNRRTLVQSGETVKVWIKDEPFSTQKNAARRWLISKRRDTELPTKGYEFYSNSLTLYEINCKARKTRVISGVDYDINGEILWSIDIEVPEAWKNIIPDSQGDSMFSKICLDINSR